MSKNDKDPDLPRHSEPQPGASVLLRGSDDGDVTISFSDGSESLTMNRRDFMRVSGVAAATAAMSTAACREPQREIVPYVDRPEEVRIGNFQEYASTCNACPAKCGLRIKSRAGRPVKLEGNDQHPVNRGGLCARGQASYMDLYDPDRLRHPVQPDNGDGTEIDWDDVDAQVGDAVDAARNGASVRFLTDARTGPATRGLIEEIVDDLPDARHVVYEPMADEPTVAASEATYGDAHMPHYRFDRAEFILSLGSDFLGTWLSPVEFTRDFADGRDFFEAEQQHEEVPDPDYDPDMNRMVAFEPTMTVTGVNADDRYRVRPDDLVYLALGLAHELFQQHDPGGIPGGAVQAALAPFDVESVADRLGADVDANLLRDIAAELAAHQGSSLVIAGGASSNSAGGIGLETAVNLLNAALQNDGQTVDRTRPSYQAPGGDTQLLELIDEMEAGGVDLLIVDGPNPVYSHPDSDRVADALDQVDLVVSTSQYLDETAAHADIVAAGCHFLECWGDANPREGVYSIQQPAILPLYETRSFEDSLIHWFGDEQHNAQLAGYLEEPQRPEEGGGQRGVDRPYDPGPFYRYLSDRWESEVFAQLDAVASFEQFWNDAKRTGVVEVDVEEGDTPSFNPGMAAELLPDELPQPEDVDPAALDEKMLHLFKSVPMYDGRHANNGHLQELPEPVTKNTWGAFAMVSWRTFEEAGLEQGQILEFETENGDTLRFPVICIPGMHDDVIALPLGYGRTDAGNVGNEVGANAFRLAEVDDNAVYYSGITPASISATGDTEELALTQHGEVLEVDYRRILSVANREQYAEDQSAGVYHTPVEYSLWPEHDFGPVKWGMAIDLTKCTGCSACVIACQEENNIPVVGKQGVLEDREMHWLRLDRYYRLPDAGVEERKGLLGDPMYEDRPLIAFGEYLERPRVIMQPMLCQHCDKAPCESVCPVVATMQSSDGLNQMAYNRCVGTRYCANNCPYKVRRFNWFNYAENREDSIFARMYPELEDHGRLNQTEPLQLGLNPDVTVRTRGVMEKCTFCVQRIRRGKWEVAKEGRRTFEDGEVQTACQESCPAGAIEFGDLLDEDHRVSKMHHLKRAMYALSDLDTQPGLAYLTSIFNTDESLASEVPGQRIVPSGDDSLQDDAQQEPS